MNFYMSLLKHVGFPLRENFVTKSLPPTEVIKKTWRMRGSKKVMKKQ